MHTITFEQNDAATGEVRTYQGQVEDGKTVGALGVDLGLLSRSACGGRGICGKCRVQVNGSAPEPTTADKRAFTTEELADGWRLACRLVAQDDLVLQLPPAETGLQVAVEGRRRLVDVEPLTEKIVLHLPPPDLEDQRSDWQRLTDALTAVGHPSDSGSLEVWRHLPRALRAGKFTATVAVHGQRVLDLQPGDTTSECYGLAFDVGTTTVVGALMDLRTGEQLAIAADLNGQAGYGGDVLSRMTFAQSDPQGVEKLQRRILGTINGLIDSMVAESQVARESIYELTLVGNTTMEHLFLGLDPSAVAVSPFVPVVNRLVQVPAAELGIAIHPRALTTVFPVIGGYVGGDTVGVILTTDMHRDPRVRLAMDIGTNGEIVLGSKDRLLACSTAAGPAFEGAQISCGMRAAHGAIEEVRIDGELHLKVIGGAQPVGVCGSGLLDAVAELYKMGLIHPGGRLLSAEDAPSTVPAALAERVQETETGRAFMLASESPANGQPLYLTQQDIRQLQLAKGAMLAGVQILEKELGVEHEEVEEVMLAGAFGNYLNPDSALAVGLFPPTRRERVVGVGNAAAEGARLALLSRSEQQTARTLPNQVEYVELASRADFDMAFLEALSFPTP